MLDSGVLLVEHIWGTCDHVVFNAILGSFVQIVIQTSLNSKMSGRRTKRIEIWESKTQVTYGRGVVDVVVVNVIFGVIPHTCFRVIYWHMRLGV